MRFPYVILIVLFALLPGFVAGYAIAPKSLPESAIPADSDNDDSSIDVASLAPDRESQEAVRLLESERQTLLARILELESLASSQDEGVPPPPEPEPGPTPPLVYGEWAHTDVLKEVEWDRVAGLTRTLHEALAERVSAYKRGEPSPPGLNDRILWAHVRMVAHFAPLVGRMPTHYTGMNHGEQTHPLVLMNMLATQLEHIGLPLDEAQAQALVSLGEEYDRRWSGLLAAHDENTLEMRKIMDEAQLKHWFCGEMFGALTVSQRDRLIPENVSGLMGMNMYSAGAFLALLWRPVWVGDMKSEWDATLKERMCSDLELTAGQLDIGDFVFRQWAGSLDDPADLSLAPVPDTDSLIRFGMAQVEAFETLYSLSGMDPEVRDALRRFTGLFVPAIGR